MQALSNIFWLGTKELRSFFSDFVLLGLVIYTFSFAIYVQGHSNAQELRNASVGYVDQDDSRLSRRMIAALLPPEFRHPVAIESRDIDHLMNTAVYTFVIVIPPGFEKDVLARRSPAVQVNVDATAMVQAGLGYNYIQQILTTEINNFVSRNEGQFLSHSQNIPMAPITLAVRVAFNPNVNTAWFTAIMGIVNNVAMLAIILAGAAVVREREHGTMDHLLVMPVSPFEIAVSKIWANGLVITIAASLSLEIVARQLLKIPIIGSVPLFTGGVAIYLFFATAVGIFPCDHRSLNAAAWLAVYSCCDADEHPVWQHDATRIHAGGPENRHDGFAFNAFRPVCPIDPVSGRRSFNRVATVSLHCAGRRNVSVRRIDSFPLCSCPGRLIRCASLELCRDLIASSISAS